LLFMSLVMNLNDICSPRVAISALRGLDYLVSALFLALFDLFFLNRKSYITQLSILLEESRRN